MGTILFYPFCFFPFHLKPFQVGECQGSPFGNIAENRFRRPSAEYGNIQQ